MTYPEPPFALTQEERLSAVWVRIRGHLEKQLIFSREKNDSSSLCEQETAFLRGKIAAIKQLLRVEQDQTFGSD